MCSWRFINLAGAAYFCACRGFYSCIYKVLSLRFPKFSQGFPWCEHLVNCPRVMYAGLIWYSVRLPIQRNPIHSYLCSPICHCAPASVDYFFITLNWISQNNSRPCLLLKHWICNGTKNQGLETSRKISRGLGTFPYTNPRQLFVLIFLVAANENNLPHKQHSSHRRDGRRTPSVV